METSKLNGELPKPARVKCKAKAPGLGPMFSGVYGTLDPGIGYLSDGLEGGTSLFLRFPAVNPLLESARSYAGSQ